MFTAILGLLLPTINKALDFIPNPQEREKAKLELQTKLMSQELEVMKVLAQADTNQTEINKEEAKSSNLFVSGWRPSLGWVCSSAFGWVYVVEPMLSFFLTAIGHPVSLPKIEFGEMSSILLGMLGLGGMRTFEKIKGVASK